MGIVFVFQYRGEKARLFSVYRDDASKYLEGFFGDDLRRFKLPVDPHECHLKAWRASRVLCKWETRRDSVRGVQRGRGWMRVEPMLLSGSVRAVDAGDGTNQGNEGHSLRTRAVSESVDQPHAYQIDILCQCEG